MTTHILSSVGADEKVCLTWPMLHREKLTPGDIDIVVNPQRFSTITAVAAIQLRNFKQKIN